MSERGEQNEIGYRNVDEDAQHDEAGSHGAGLATVSCQL